MGSLEGPINEVFQTFSLILTALQAVLWPILILIGGLLNNDLLFSGGMNTMLQNIWMAVRDFVNILFVLGLLVVAIVNIVGVGKEDLAISKVLPKIAIALIAVNFSFLACKVVLDAVNVGTTAIFAIPLASDSLKKYSDPAELDALSDKFCNKINNLPDQQSTDNPYCEPVKAEAANAGQQGSEAPQGGGGTNQDAPTSAVGGVKAKLSDKGKEFFSTFNSRNVAIIMAVELMNITDIDEVKKVDVQSLKDLAVNTLFSMIFLVIYGTAFVALFVALLVRVVVLWIAIALSPLSFLGIAFGQIKNKFGDDDPFFKLFFKHALIPLPVAVILTIGMIMITQLQQMFPAAQFATASGQLGAITSGMSTVQEIMAGLATAAFIWIAAFKALEGTKADFLVQPIKGAVERFGKGVAKLPLYAPILPVGGEKVGLAALGSALAGPELLAQREQSRYAEIFGDKNTKLIKDLEQAKNQTEARSLIAQMILAKGHKLDKEMQEAIAKSLEKYNIKDLSLPAGMTMASLLKDLKEGTVNESQFKQIMDMNKGKLKAPEMDIKGTQEQADAAKKAAEKPPVRTNVKFEELETATKKLNDAQSGLQTAANNNNVTEVERKKGEIKAQIAVIQPIVAARDKIQTNKDYKTAFNADGTVKDTNVAKSIKDQYDDLAKVSKEPAKAQALLREKLEAEFGKGPHIDTILNQITSGNFAGTPPAAQPPAPGPAPQNPPPPANQ